MNESGKIVSDAVEKSFHCLRVAVGYDFLQAFERLADFRELFRSIRIKKNLRKQEIVFAHEPAGYSHVALEGSSGSILMFHDRSEHQRRSERYRERICYDHDAGNPGRPRILMKRTCLLTQTSPNMKADCSVLPHSRNLPRHSQSVLPHYLLIPTWLTFTVK